MKRNMIMLLAAALFVVAGCKKDDKTTEGEKMTFNAGFDNGNAKTEINGLDMSWNKGDAVMINGKTFTADQSGRNTTLSGERTFQEGGLYKAYFPASMYDNGTLTLPATQTYNGKNLSGVNPMYAQSESTNLTFSNLCAMVKLQLTGSKTVKEIRVSADQPLSGEFEIAESGSNYKAVLKSKTGNAGVTLSCGTGVNLSENNVFYVALPEGTYTNLKFFVETADNMCTSIDIPEASFEANVLRELVREPEFHTIVTPTSVTITAGCVNCTYTVSGKVTVPSGSHVCEFGLVYSETDETPTIEEGALKIVAHTLAEDAISGTVNFDADITVLPEDVKYYVRTYAICDKVKYSSDIKKITYTTPKPLPTSWNNGRNPHPFSVANDKVVYFSQGNLQYRAKGGSAGDATATAESGQNVGGTWRFAEHQFDIVGDATLGNVYEGDVKCNNAEAAQDYNGWIDLFGWGTSGYNHGAVCYQPWSTSQTDGDYYNHNLYYQTPAIADWGSNNITNGVGYNWRVLTASEWNFLQKRNSNSLFGYVLVGNCIEGVLILPDDWKWEGDVAGFESSWIPGGNGAYHRNPSYTYSELAKLEAAGAVFLPCNGYRNGNSFVRILETGSYYSSSIYGGGRVYSCYFYAGSVKFYGASFQHYFNGLSIRLVTDN